VRTFVVVHVTKLVEPLLLTLHGLLRRPGCFRFERAVHPLVCAVLLGVSRHDALDRDAEPDPPQ